MKGSGHIEILKRTKKEMREKTIQFTKPGASEVSNSTNLKNLLWESDELKF